jgi:hypothetical protein
LKLQSCNLCATSSLFGDFNSLKERSWVLTYNLGVPGLSSMIRTGADYSNAGNRSLKRL